MERTSRWPEAIPIAAMSTVDCANALFQGWVSRFEVPAGVPNGMVEHFHPRLKDVLHGRCPAANWVDHIPWVLLGLRPAAREDDGTAPAQAVFSSPLILPGKFLDSPELPSKDFLEQFSKTLSAAEHSSTRHNTIATAAPARRPRPRTYGVHEGGTATYRRFNHSTTAPTPSFAAPCIISRCVSAKRRTRCPPSGSNPAPTPPHRLRSQGSGAACTQPSASGIFSLQGPQRPAGYISPRSSQQNCVGNLFSLANRQGFLHTPPPFSSTPPLGLPATPPSPDQIRPLGLHPQGLGEPCGGYEKTFEGTIM
jgi:hypothetical protein